MGHTNATTPNLPPDPSTLPALDAEVSAAVRRLFGMPDWDDLSAHVHSYLDDHPESVSHHEALYRFFAGYCNGLVGSGAHARAAACWERLVRIITAWEEKRPGARVLKGTPYYWWGGISLLLDQLDRGFRLIHAALLEDVWAETNRGLDSHRTLPAWKFVTLRHEDPANVWQPQLVEVAERLQSYISHYNRDCSRQLTLADIRSRFLDQPGLEDVVSFFVYALFRIHKTASSGSPLQGSFATLLALDLARSVYVVLEELLKEEYRPNYPDLRTLHALIQKFSKDHGLGVHEPAASTAGVPRIEFVKQHVEDAATRDATIGDLLAGTLPGFGPAEVALALAPPLRNLSSHGVDTIAALDGQLNGTLQLALNALFVVIDHRQK